MAIVSTLVKTLAEHANSPPKITYPRQQPSDHGNMKRARSFYENEGEQKTIADKGEEKETDDALKETRRLACMQYHVSRADNADEHARVEVERLLGRADVVFEQRASVKAEAKFAAE